MSGFDAGSAVEPLDFDFSKYSGPVGTIEEPTTGDVDKLGRKLKEIFGGDLDLEEAATRLAALSEEEQTAAVDKLLDAVAKLCKGNPSREAIELLPYRVQQAFLGWLFGQVFAPEA